MTFPNLIVEFSPTTGPFDTPVWIALSEGGPHGNRVLSAEWVDGKQADLEEFPPGEATIVLRNDDRLFDPEHATGTYFGDLNPRVPFRIRASNLEELTWDGDPLTWDGDDLVWSTETYDLFYGFVEDGWEQTYHPPEGSTCTVKLVDLLGVLSGYTLPSVLEAEILADSPVAYWPLDETSGQVMRDATGLGNDGEYVHGTTGLSTTAESANGFGQLGIDFDGEHFGFAAGPTAAVTTRPAVIEALVAPADDPEPTAAIYRSGTGNANQGITLQRSGIGDGVVGFAIGFRDGGTNPAVTSVNVSATAGVRHLAGRGASSSASAIYIDGVDASNTSPGVAAQDALPAGSGIGARKVSGGSYDHPFLGFVSHVAIFDYDIGTVRIAAHAAAALAPLDGQRSDEQIQWALDTIGVPVSMYDLDAGRSIMGPANTEGRNALAFIREVTATEQGAFFVDHSDAGKLRFRQRYASFQDTRSTVAQVTFSDDPVATAVARVEPDALRLEANGIATVINQAAVTWRGGEEVVDQSTGSQYGPRPLSVTTQSATPAVARGIGQWIISLNDTPKARIRSLGINPGANHDEFPYALGTQVGDRAAYRSKPQDTGAATTKQLEVLGRHHAVQGLNWETEFYLTAAVADGVDLFTLGVSELGGTHILAY